MFKVGDKVLMNETGLSRYSNLNGDNPRDTPGRISELRDGDEHFSISVKWENGEWNNYDECDLDLIDKPAIDPTTKLTNPKDSIGSDKIPLHLWPTTATVLGSMALLDGGLKYGRSNFRGVGVRASIYIDALQRHLFRWSSGEDKDPDSGLSHLAHILAGVAILVDAQAADKLNDDREFPGGLTKLIEELTPHVKRLKEQHKDKSPHHYTLADTLPVSK